MLDSTKLSKDGYPAIGSEGAPGAGKTMLGLQFLLEGSPHLGEAIREEVLP